MISDLTTTDVGLSVIVAGARVDLSWRWLRDHARDPASYLASANQRLVTPDVVAAAGPGVAHIDGTALVVDWPGTIATFEAAFLRDLAPAAEMYAAPGEPARAWVGNELDQRLDRIPFTDLIDADLINADLVDDALDGDARGQALTELCRNGVITVTDVPIDNASTRRVLELFGYVRSTIFGDLWEFSSDESAGKGFDDTASTPLEITPHTDGTYSNDAPGLLGLHCHIYEATGGENVFVDSHALAARLTDDERELLSTIDIPGQYIGDGAHLLARRPALRYDGDRLVQVSYNHHDRAPFLLPEPTMTELYAALTRFDELANDGELQFELAMRPGDMVIFDNWRVLHGRRAFVGARHIAGGYINREDVDSTMRLHRAR